MIKQFKDANSQIQGMRTYEIPQNQKDYVKSNPYFKAHVLQTVPIKQLIKDNNLEDPTIYDDRDGLWSKNPREFDFDETKNVQANEPMYATLLENGKYKIGGGRHRIRALANKGYTDVRLPVLNNLENNKYVQSIRTAIDRNDPKELENIIKQIPYVKEIPAWYGKTLINDIMLRLSGDETSTNWNKHLERNKRWMNK